MDKIDKTKLQNIPKIRTSKQRMEDARNMPPIQQLVGQIWQTNEIHILFADTGVGKSIIAVAIANALSKGEKFLFLENENTPLKVIYYDFELSDGQFMKRYINIDKCEYIFNENLYIDTIDFAELDKQLGNNNFTDSLFAKIRYDIETIKPSVLIIDNITFLNMQSTQETQIALDVMRRLNELKKEFNISILVLAHTPKKYGNEPLTLNDLAGSKQLSNFADSVSAIGKSIKEKSIRYWKQVKPSRSGEMIFDSTNVIELEIVKEDAFLTMKFLNFGEEKAHLNENRNSTKKPLLLDAAIELLNKGKTYDEIATQLGISKGTITKWKTKNPNLFDFVSDVS